MDCSSVATVIAAVFLAVLVNGSWINWPTWIVIAAFVVTPIAFFLCLLGSTLQSQLR